MIVEATLFTPPNGTQSIVQAEVSDDLRDQYYAMLNASCRFTVEPLRDGKVSICIEDPDIGDFDIRIVDDHPDSMQVVEEMLREFDLDELDQWREVMEG